MTAWTKPVFKNGRVDAPYSPLNETVLNQAMSALDEVKNGASTTYVAAGSGDTSGVTDTAVIQAALTAAAPYGGKVVLKRGSAYYCNADLIASSGVHVRATWATVNLIGNAAGHLLKNAALGGSGARDSDIVIEGGTWTRDATVSTKNIIALHRVDGVKIKDAKFSSSHGKSAIMLADLTNFRVRDIYFNAVYSGGIQLQGPASDGVVEKISGSAGDDVVALGGRDYAGYELTSGGGNIANITVRDVNGTMTGNGALVHVFAGASVTARDIVVEKVRGTSNQAGVSVSDDNLDANTTGQDVTVTVRDVACTVGNGFGLVTVNGASVRSVTIDGVHLLQSTSTVYGVLANSRTVATRIVADNIFVKSDQNHSAINVVFGASVTLLSSEGCSLVLDATRTNGRFAVVAGTVSQFVVSNLEQTGGASCILHNATVALTALVGNVSLTNVGAAFYSAGTAPFTLLCGPVSFATGTLFQVTSASGGLVIQGGPFTVSGTTLFRSSTQSVRVNAPTLSANISALTPSAGDTVTNSAAASGVLPGTGLVNYDGTTWRLASIGAVKSGTAVLVAGTVIVADTAITANSIIRLSRKTIGGTPGALYISALTAATSFAITSTNAADTSTVYYEIVTY